MGRNERSLAGNVVCWMTSASLIPVLWLGCTWSNDCLASRLIDEEECLYLPPVQQSELAEARETARKNSEVIKARIAELIKRNEARGTELDRQEIASVGHL